MFQHELLMALFLIVGAAIGSWVQRFLDQEPFQKIVAVILAVTGILQI
jgi:uncharacterized membrane protein YfcA